MPDPSLIERNMNMAQKITYCAASLLKASQEHLAFAFLTKISLDGGEVRFGDTTAKIARGFNRHTGALWLASWPSSGHRNEHERRRREDATERATQYHGEYIGDGQSKTAFELQCPNASFDGAILKVARLEDMEPNVFGQACRHNVTHAILANCTGAHGNHKYHCWRTERTIPLDQFTRYHGANKKKCTLAAFLCML